MSHPIDMGEVCRIVRPSAKYTDGPPFYWSVEIRLLLLGCRTLSEYNPNTHAPGRGGCHTSDRESIILSGPIYRPFTSGLSPVSRLYNVELVLPDGTAMGSACSATAAHVSWVGAVSCTSCTTSKSDRRGSVDVLQIGHDLSVLDLRYFCSD